MTFDEFLKKYEGKSWGYPAGSYVGECLSLTKWHIKEVYGINPPPSGVNSAYGYWTNFPNPLGTVFKRIIDTPNLIPEKGWIVVWNEKVGNGYGHIASIISANINSFISFDQNWGSKTAQRVTHNYNNVYGYLAPKQGSSEPESTNMTHEQFYTKFLEAFRKYKDTLEWGDDKHKFESDGLKDEAMIGRMIDSLARDKASKAEELKKCQDKPPQVVEKIVEKEVIKEVPVEVIKEVHVVDMSKYEDNGIKIEEQITPEMKRTTNYARKA